MFVLMMRVVFSEFLETKNYRIHIRQTQYTSKRAQAIEKATEDDYIVDRSSQMVGDIFHGDLNQHSKFRNSMAKTSAIREEARHHTSSQVE